MKFDKVYESERESEKERTCIISAFFVFFLPSSTLAFILTLNILLSVPSPTRRERESEREAHKCRRSLVNP